MTFKEFRKKQAITQKTQSEIVFEIDLSILLRSKSVRSNNLTKKMIKQKTKISDF